MKFFLFSLIFLTTMTFPEKVSFKPEELTAQKNSYKASEQAIEKEFPKPDFQKALVKMMASIVAIIVLAIITVYAFRKLTRSRFSQANNGRNIKILEKRIISPKSILYLVEYEGIKALVSESHLDVRIKLLK